MHHLANCADGFAAACIARHALLSQGIPETDINVQPVNYGQPDQMPLGKNGILFPGDTITYLDYTPPQETLDAFYTEHGVSLIPLTIIDHHSTAAERHGRDKATGFRNGSNPPRFNSWFNLNHSGASLAWTHFIGQAIPRAVELIEWRDLGHAFDPINAEDPRTADSLNLHAYLFRCLPRTFAAWTPLLLGTQTLDIKPFGGPGLTGNELADPHQCSCLPVSWSPSLRAALTTGSRIRTIDACIIAAAVNGPHWLNFHGEEIPAVNGLDASLISDACTELLRSYPTAPFAASWFINPKTGQATYSLRSRRGSTVNVAEIAAAMAPGGGGHPNAAGFSTPIPVPFV